MNRECILEQAKQHDSFYLYEEAIIRKNTEQLKTDFPGVTFLYSVKCNPYPEVLRCVLNQGFGVDAASLAECVMGQKAGLGKDMVIFSAPGKTMADIRGGLGISTLVADSAAEVDRMIGDNFISLSLYFLFSYPGQFAELHHLSYLEHLPLPEKYAQFFPSLPVLLTL